MNSLENQGAWFYKELEKYTTGSSFFNILKKIISTAYYSDISTKDGKGLLILLAVLGNMNNINISAEISEEENDTQEDQPSPKLKLSLYSESPIFTIEDFSLEDIYTLFETIKNSKKSIKIIKGSNEETVINFNELSKIFSKGLKRDNNINNDTGFLFLQSLFNLKNKKDEELVELYCKGIPCLLEQKGYLEMLWVPSFIYFIIILCHSVLSCEYTILSSCSKDLAEIRKKFDIVVSKRDCRDFPDLPGIIADYCNEIRDQLTNYIAFNTAIDLQMSPGKDISSLLSYDDELAYRNSYFRYIEFVDNYYINKSDSRPLFQSLGIVFQFLIEMTKIDHNYILTKNNFRKLLFLNEILNDGDYGLIVILEDKKNELPDYFGAVKPKLLRVLKMIDLKNRYLIYKISHNCKETIKNYSFLSYQQKGSFNDDNYAFLKETKLDNNALSKIQKTIENTTEETIGETNEEAKKKIKLFDYEKQKNIKESKRDYINNIKASQKSLDSSMFINDEFEDISSYDKKISDMFNKVVVENAEWRWYYNHWDDGGDGKMSDDEIMNVFEEFLKFLDKNYDTEVCYDKKLLVNYTQWCLTFLEQKRDNISQDKIERVLLLAETLKKLIRRLRHRMRDNIYSIPFASVFRGGFYQLSYESEEIKNAERIFVDNGDKESFNLYLNSNTNTNPGGNAVDKKANILFIASTHNPPVDYEDLESNYRTLTDRIKKQRDTIHSNYFKKIRVQIQNDVKEDTEKQSERHRQSLIQILGIFSSFIALVTVALTGTISDKVGDSSMFLPIMFGFTTCIVIFVVLLAIVTYRNDKKQVIETEGKTKKKCVRVKYTKVCIVVVVLIITISLTILTFCMSLKNGHKQECDNASNSNSITTSINVSNSNESSQKTVK